MEEERKIKWRLKKCCCFPLRSGVLCLAYFNATLVFLMHMMGDFSPAIIDMIFMEVGVAMSFEQHPFIYMLPIVIEYVFVLVLIHALHTSNSPMLCAYMCYVVVYISARLLNLLSYFTSFHLFFICIDSLYFIYLLLLVHSVRVEIRLEKMDLLSPRPQASEISLHPTAPPAQPDKMAADTDITSI